LEIESFLKQAEFIHAELCFQNIEEIRKKKLLFNPLQALRFLDYQQPPRDLSPLVSAADQSREEDKRRGNNHQLQQPLLFFLSNSLWESGHNWAKSAWFIPTNEGPEGKMVSVMHEVLARIFEGGPIPWVLFDKIYYYKILHK
jgi:hypothetical protein